MKQVNFFLYLFFFILVVLAWVIVWELCDKIVFPIFRNINQGFYLLILLASTVVSVAIIYILNEKYGDEISLF